MGGKRKGKCESEEAEVRAFECEEEGGVWEVRDTE